MITTKHHKLLCQYLQYNLYRAHIQLQIFQQVENFGLRDKQKVGERDLAYKKKFWKCDVEYLRNIEE